MALKVGSRLRAQNSSVEVIVVKGSDSDATLSIGGVELLDTAPTGDVPQLTEGPAVELGKRYTDAADTIEVLAAKAGIGPLVYGGEELSLKSAKALPASD